jgi:hypothetical protein
MLSKAAAIRVGVRRQSRAEMQIFDRRWKEAAANDESWTDYITSHQKLRSR